MTELSDEQKRDFEAAAFRRLVEHLRERGDVARLVGGERWRIGLEDRGDVENFGYLHLLLFRCCELEIQPRLELAG